MIKEFIEKLMKNSAEKAVNNVVADKNHTDITPYIKYISDELNIDVPKIQPVAMVFESSHNESGEKMVMAQARFIEEELPEDAVYLGAYYQYENDTILVGNKYPHLDFRSMKMNYADTTSAEKLSLLSHELRHVWQKKYYEETYYKNNAVGMETINDISEIDADAYAIAFVLSDRTPFTYEDLPSILRDYHLQGTLDGGKRWSRAEELSNQYQLHSTEKIHDAMKAINIKEVSSIITIMKISGQIQ